jgi:hypothetical protein
MPHAASVGKTASKTISKALAFLIPPNSFDFVTKIYISCFDATPRGRVK